MSELNNKDKNELEAENKENKENNINQKMEENEEEEDDIDSTNNLMDKLTFGCSNSSFKIPQINAINFDTNSNKNETEQNDSEIIGISDDYKYKNIQSLNNMVNKIGENNLEKESNKINNKNNEDKKSINQSLKDLFFVNKNKNEIISIRSTKNDLTSNDSNNIFRNNNPINQSLNNSIYGNKPKNDIISMNSNNNYNETNNDTESINQSLINLIINQNETVSIKSNELETKKNLNLKEMFEDFENKSKIDEINKKVSESGFIHIYDDNKNKKNNKHVQIIDEPNINESEKLYIFNVKGMMNKNINIDLPKKNTIDQVKYYEILCNNNPNINRKIH